MAKYSETVLYSSTATATGNITLSDTISSYDFLRVSYGTPAIPRTSGTTAFPNLGDMYTVEIPKGTNWLNLYSEFYGGCNTASATNRYRANALYSGVTGSAWAMVFNRYGNVTAYSATTNAGWNNIYSVVGVRSGEPGDFHRDLLFSRDRDGAAVKLSAHPSGYNRIGISFSLPGVESTRTIETYREYPYSFLSTFNKGNIVLQHPFYTSPASGSQRYEGLSMYSGCSGTAWGRVWRMNFYQTANTGSLGSNAADHVITRVVGIDRK